MDYFLKQELNPVNFAVFLLSAVALLAIVLVFVMYSIYVQRKILAWMQGRIGPNRVGPYGLFQTVADVLKVLLKEDIIPSKVDRPLFIIAPIISFVPAFSVLAVMPFTDQIHFADLEVGLLYYIGISSISTMGVLMGGWASNNKWSLIGAMRAGAQMISYELPLVMAALGVVLMAGSMNLMDIVHAQKNMWNIIPQFLGFVVFFIASLSELNRTPFDLTEAESELIAGYQTEYSGFRFATFMLTEYTYLFTMGALVTVLYLGGWYPPLP
ncbi:MAG: NADH-quinone oxidoreductase subunit NuoH, partial [Thermicanus sp.]|nr:NADH-quinone oxidoreductase subunit NuoH [Thermicanus sp.]